MNYLLFFLLKFNFFEMVYFAACMKGGCRVFSASGKLKSDVARENEILAHPVRLGAENKWIFLVFPQRRVSAPRATYRRKKKRENPGKIEENSPEDATCVR